MKKSLFIAALMAVIFTGAVYGALSHNKQAVKYYLTGVSLYKNNDFSGALKYYNAAVKNDPKFWQAWQEIGMCYYSMNNYPSARKVFGYVLKLKPNEPVSKKFYFLLAYNMKKKAPAPASMPKGDMMWRCAIMPGFGQFYNGETAKGYIYSAAYLASLAALITYTLNQRSAVADYSNTNFDFSGKYSAAQEAQKKVLIPAAVAVCVWSVSMLDAYLSGSDGKPAYAGNTVEIKFDKGVTVAWNIARVDF